jgi:hypothetical protein
MRYLINIKDGTIYEWDEILAANALCRECSEQEAFPEKFIAKSALGRVPKVKLNTPDIPPQEEPADNSELNADASQGLPK